MSEASLSRRHQEVLNAVVNEYVETAGPVGSRTVARKYPLNLSPATIRNVMADLETLGLVIQPYTSAGRIPTNEGYRYYVNSLLKVKNLPSEERDEIRRQFEKIRADLEHLLLETSRILSRFSRYTGMVWSPRTRALGVFRNIDFFRIEARRILAVVTYSSGFIRTRVIPVEDELSQRDLTRMSDFLNRELSGLPPEELREKLVRKVEEEVWEFILVEALGLRDSTSDAGEVYIEGQLNILDLPDFSDRNRLRDVLRILEEKRMIVQLLNQTLAQQGMRVIIGVEDTFRELPEVSLVSVSYGLPENPVGSLGVLGPTRMNYSRIIPLVQYTADLVSDLLAQN